MALALALALAPGSESTTATRSMAMVLALGSTMERQWLELALALAASFACGHRPTSMHMSGHAATSLGRFKTALPIFNLRVRRMVATE